MAVVLGTAAVGVALLALLYLRLAIAHGELDPGQLRRFFTGVRAGTNAPGRVAVLIATHNGESSVAATIHSVGDQADVYVVSDGSSDETAAVARATGAHVLELRENIGKPAALYRANVAFKLTKRYEALVILDDDTVVAPDFVAQSLAALEQGVAIVVGQTLSRWDHGRRWNVWIGSRAYAYWRYQVTMRRGQSALNVMNCISGSNSLYRSSVLDQVLMERTPYIVDDTFWTLEVHRRGLGRIVYQPRAKAWICDPTSFRAWYAQNLRWLWGTFQGIQGHRVGRRWSRFDIAYVALIVDWVIYVTAAPLVGFLTFWSGWLDPARFLTLYGLGVLVWVVLAAASTRKWRMVLMAPAIVVIDWVYRLTFLHALARTALRPQVEACKWASPARY